MDDARLSRRDLLRALARGAAAMFGSVPRATANTPECQQLVAAKKEGKGAKFFQIDAEENLPEIIKTQDIAKAVIR